MNLASEISGSDAMARIQSRVEAYWNRQMQRRLIASLNGILLNNVATGANGGNDGDMVVDISAATGSASAFTATAVIDAAATLGDRMDGLSAIAMHSDIYTAALKADLIATIEDSKGQPFRTFRGLAVIVDDGLPLVSGVYTSVLFGAGAVGYGFTDPRIADGTEVEKLPSAGRGGGQEVLHSRVNVAVHPLGFNWLEGSVADESPSLAELALAANWSRVAERKAVPLAFLKTK